MMGRMSVTKLNYADDTIRCVDDSGPGLGWKTSTPGVEDIHKEPWGGAGGLYTRKRRPVACQHIPLVSDSSKQWARLTWPNLQLV